MAEKDPITEMADLGEALCDVESQPGWRRLRERIRPLREDLGRALEEGGAGG